MKKISILLLLLIVSCKKEETPQTVVTTPTEKECRCDETLYQKVNEDTFYSIMSHIDSLDISCDSTKVEFSLDSSSFRVLNCYEI